ncbi:SDR family NAD(P)-dependent oxidoreductase [Maricaulaceae bacterium EIL42A08]|nr:SDR family NAD(P)-dependent oxidoreductase [Maricaulaceae bacterium EIL42A08]
MGISERWMVTGASRGIGLALSRAHVARGGQLVGNYRGNPPAELVELQDQNRDRVQLCAFDLRAGDIKQKLQDLDPGPIDVLINNGGINGPKKTGILGQDCEQALDVFNVNALGAVRVIESALPFLSESENPRVATISSLLGTFDKAAMGRFAYGLSKAALNFAVHLAAHEFYEKGIAFACLRPGHVQTRMNGFTGPMTPDESAQALLPIIDTMKPELPPPFFDYTGDRMDW